MLQVERLLQQRELKQNQALPIKSRRFTAQSRAMRAALFFKICLAKYYKFVMIGQTCRLITAEVKPPRLMKWIGRSSLWSGLRLPLFNSNCQQPS
jgi:hypothetical protein